MIVKRLHFELSVEIYVFDTWSLNIWFAQSSIYVFCADGCMCSRPILPETEIITRLLLEFAFPRKMPLYLDHYFV